MGKKPPPRRQVAHATQSGKAQRRKAFIFIASEGGRRWESFRHQRKTFIKIRDGLHPPRLPGRTGRFWSEEQADP